MSLDRAPFVCGRAGVNTRILRLGVVNNQLADIGDHHISMYVVWFNDHIALALHLLLPGDLRLRPTSNFTKEAGCLTGKHRLLRRASQH